jgi:DNA-binding NarL/FixJ family response regulator
MLVSRMTASHHETVTTPPVRVVVVDNDTLLVGALRVLFADEPTLRFVGGACTVAEGIELVASRQPDVLVVDVRMPAGGGVAVAAQARELAPNTAVLAMSASDDEDARAEMAAAGAVGYVVKDGLSAVGELLHTIDVVGHPSATGSRPAA